MLHCLGPEFTRPSDEPQATCIFSPRLRRGYRYGAFTIQRLGRYEGVQAGQRVRYGQAPESTAIVPWPMVDDETSR